MASSTDIDWTMGGMDDPLTVQGALLDRFEQETNTVIVDTNNPACVIMEGMASLTSGLIRKIEDTVRGAIYPARANTVIDLYKHLSDYDYKDIFSSPASTTMVMVLDKQYVINNSVAVDGASYKKMVVPSTSRFTIGDHTFGIYYPIEIRTNTNTGRLTVVYDQSEENPLSTLKTSVLEYETRKFRDRDIIYIMIPIYQFEITNKTYNIVSGTGFKETIPYDNKFYAIRCKAQVLQNPGHDDAEEDRWETQELGLCVSGQTYDPESPTVVFTPDLENNTVTVEIPYVYVTNGLVRGTLDVYLYTTEGAINYVIPPETMDACLIDMFTQITSEEVAKYAEPFRQMGGLTIFPNGTNVIGGSDGMDFDTLRKRVVTGTLKSKTLQTPDDIEAYFDNQGYVATLLRDGVTDRVFVAHSTVMNADNTIVSADEIGTLFDFRPDSLVDYDTIVKSSPDVFTVLPSTIYKFDSARGICTPLTSTEPASIKTLTPAATVDTFNNNTYTISPFHLQVDTSSKYPTTVTYDMSNAKFVAQSLIAERVDENVPCQLTFNSGNLKVVKSDIKDFFRLTIKVSRSGLDDVDAVVTRDDMVGTKNFRVLIAFKNDDGTFYYGEAEWVSRTDDFDIFQFDIYSDYKFKQANNNHTVSLWINNNASDKGEESDFLLTTELRIILTVKGSLDVMSGVKKSDRALDTDYTNVSVLDDLSNYYAMSETKLVVKFGSVVNELDQRINLAYSEMQYKKYDTTKFMTLESPAYVRDHNGDLVIDVGYFITKDIMPVAGKTYCRKNLVEGGTPTYEEIEYDTDGFDGAGTDDDPWRFKTDVMYYERSTNPNSVNVARKFDTGTMTCLTHTQEESTIVNERTRSNYVGCRYVRSVDGGEHEGVLTEDTSLVDDDGNPVTFGFSDAPIIPSFSVEQARLSSEGDSLALGKYQLENAFLKSKDDRGSSCPDDVWVKAGIDAGDLVGKPSKIIADDALYFVWTRLIVGGGQVIDAAQSTTPLKNVVAPQGTFLLVNNDCSGFDEEAPEISVVENHDLVHAISKLYYCYSAVTSGGSTTQSDWVCVGQGENQADMEAEILANHDANRAGRKSYGYVYIGDFATKNDSGATYAQTFVSYLNTTQYKGHTVPSFRQFYVDYEKPVDADMESDINTSDLYFYKDVSTGVVDDDPIEIGVTWKTVGDIPAKEGHAVVRRERVPECGWSNNVNKWPWDAQSWCVESVGAIKTQARSLQCKYHTVDTDFVIAFDNSRISKYCAYTSGQYELDVNGNLQEAEGGERRLQYLVSMTQLDAKLMFTTTNKATGAYPADVTNVLRTHFDNLGETKNRVFTNTRLYWAPLRSLGVATFNINADETRDLNLDISVGFRIHVEAGDAKDTTLVRNIKDRLIAITDECLKQETFSCIEVANRAQQEMSETIKQIDVLGINGDVTLQTLQPVDPEVRCHLAHTLELLDDDLTIDLSRALTMEVVGI